MNGSQNCSLVQVVAIAVAEREPVGYGGSAGQLLPHASGLCRTLPWINDSNSAFTHHLQQTIAPLTSSMPMPNRSG